MTYDDRDVLMTWAGGDRHCAISIQAMEQVPVEHGDDGPACHPELIQKLAQDLKVLGLCCLSKHSPLTA